MRKATASLLSISLLILFSMTAIASEEKAPPDQTPKAEVKSAEIKWVKYDEGIKTAKETGKHMLVNFTTSWCGYCKLMNKTTFKESEIVDIINSNFIAVKVDGDSKKELNVDGYKITERNLTISEFGVSSYPTYWFLKPDGAKLGNLKGYQNADPFSEILFYVKEKLYDQMTFEEFMKAGGRKEYKKV